MSTEFEFATELDDLRDAVRQMCIQYSSEAAVRAAMDSELGYNPSTWKRLGTDLGVLGLDVAEEFGGAEAGLVTQAVAVEELGAWLVCGPLFGTVMLAQPLLSALPASAEKAALLPGLAGGEVTAACAIGSFSTGFDPDAVTVTASENGDAVTLDGTVAQVVDGLAADFLLVAAKTASGVAIHLVDGDATGLSREGLSTLDLTRRQAKVTFAATPARRLGNPSESGAAITHALHVASVLLAAEQVGGAKHMLDVAVKYAKQRFQFGRSIGTFQAVKHRLVDTLVSIELARSAMFHAAWAIQDGTDDVQLAVSLAQAIASETYLSATATAIQVHGGIGITWEHQAHLYFKRASTDSLLLGRADDHYDLVGAAEIDVISSL